MSAPIRITLGVPNDSKPIPVSVASNKQRRQIDVTAPIVAETLPTYEGPYDVSPTESEHTLFTNGKKMTDDVTVCAIPADYVGSEVPRKTSADLTTSGPTVTAPAGYYAEAASKAVSSGSASTPDTEVTVDVDVSLSADGLITATASGSQSVTPDVVDGYVDRGIAGTVSVDGLKKVQLPTQAAKTVTPTETEQTAVAPQKFTTGEVKVAAIPSDYIGSEVPQKSSSDLSVSEATVTAPAGYYENAASASVPNATWKNASTVGVVPEISVDENGLITANCAGWTSIHPLTDSGYADADTAANIQLSGVKTSQLSTQSAATITPTESEQTAVAVGEYTTGAVKVGAIPSNYVGSRVPTQAAQTITPTTADQTIASGTYLTGVQTIEGVVCTNLTAENIAEGVVVKIGTATDDDSVASVTGTHSGGEDTLLKALRNQVTSVEDDTLTSIRSYGLAYMTALESVSFPNLQTINSYSFYNDYRIVWNGWPFPKAKTIGNYAFRYCYGLTGDIVLPSTVTSIGQYSFANCDHMTTFTATGAISTLGTYTFVGASGYVMALREIHMPNLGTGIALNLNFGSATAANACQHLEVCDIGKAKSIAANTFANCYKLQTLIMRRTSVTTCANVNAFLNTPLRGRNSLTAKIYVPEALIDSYKAASVWSTINGYGYVEWCKIEGSDYEL